jgi:hypothetical protein
MSKPRSTFGKGGKRADLGNRFFRSKMEANVARYLNWLIAQGQILSWLYEPPPFRFEGIKRGSIDYKPDFVVTRLNGSTYVIEVKGWMDTNSKTKLKRMAKYFPHVEIEILDKTRYAAISKWKKLIPGWEA